MADSRPFNERVYSGYIRPFLDDYVSPAMSAVGRYVPPELRSRLGSLVDVMPTPDTVTPTRNALAALGEGRYGTAAAETVNALAAPWLFTPMATEAAAAKIVRNRLAASDGLGASLDMARKAPNALLSSDPHERASQLADLLHERMPEVFLHAPTVIRSHGPAGKSAYIRTPYADVRVSDHYANQQFRVGEFDTSTLPHDAEVIFSSFKAAVLRAQQKAALQRQQEAAAKKARWEASAPQRAREHEARTKKAEFFERHGLTDSTETARKKAWKAFLKSGQTPD